MVLVDIDMPKNCSNCPFLAAIRGAVEYPVCGIDENIALDFYKMDDGRDKRCPIKTSLPKGHGDLIDRNSILCDDCSCEQCGHTDECFKLLAPTIIEADGGKKDEEKEE